MARIRVGLVGATGETGGSILEGLLARAKFDVVALVRPESLSKPKNVHLKSRGVQLRALDLETTDDVIAAALHNLDVLISAIGPRDQLAQLPLVKAAGTAGVKRLIPCGFATPMPVGVHRSRDQKEQVYNLVKRLHIPYTIIDVGWWYQFALPKLPSGKIDYAVGPATQSIPGDGNMPSAMTDLRDVGKYVAQVIDDDRTLNKMIFFHNELWTSNKIYDLLEKLSGEQISRSYTEAGKYQQQIDKASKLLQDKPDDIRARNQMVLSQYALSVGVRGENTPDFAKYLGYLDGKLLYPDIEFTQFETYVKEVLSGEVKPVYGGGSLT